MSSHFSRRGLALVELLATIAIIGLLVALLVPAIQNAREGVKSLRLQRLRTSTVGIPIGSPGPTRLLQSPR